MYVFPTWRERGVSSVDVRSAESSPGYAYALQCHHAASFARHSARQGMACTHCFYRFQCCMPLSLTVDTIPGRCCVPVHALPRPYESALCAPCPCALRPAQANLDGSGPSAPSLYFRVWVSECMAYMQACSCVTYCMLFSLTDADAPFVHAPCIAPNMLGRGNTRYEP